MSVNAIRGVNGRRQSHPIGIPSKSAGGKQGRSKGRRHSQAVGTPSRLTNGKQGSQWDSQTVGISSRSVTSKRGQWEKALTLCRNNIKVSNQQVGGPMGESTHTLSEYHQDQRTASREIKGRRHSHPIGIPSRSASGKQGGSKGRKHSQAVDAPLRSTDDQHGDQREIALTLGYINTVEVRQPQAGYGLTILTFYVGSRYARSEKSIKLDFEIYPLPLGNFGQVGGLSNTV